MTTATTPLQSSNEEKRQWHIRVAPRMLNVGILGVVVGTAVGMMRGGRAASLRFLAENAHRAPTTVQGWYFYKKTKNYRVMLGALKGAGGYGGGFGAFGVGLVGAEMGLERVGLGRVKHVGAAVGTTGVCCALFRLPMAQTRRALVMAGMVGGVMAGVEWMQGRGRSKAVD